MGLFGFFGKKAETHKKSAEREPSELDDCLGIKVEVSGADGYLFFTARVLEVEGNSARLHRLSGSDLGGGSGPRQVRIRGYSSRKRSVICLEGLMKPVSEDVWEAEDLVVTKTGNDRAYFRLDTDLDVSVVISGRTENENDGRLRNISLGGACVVLNHKVESGDTILLKVRLDEDAPESSIFCRVLRVTETEEGVYEYGCQFIRLTEDDQDRITQMILQAQKRRA